MDRRRYLRSVAAAGTVVAVAGCTDDSGNGNDGNGMADGDDAGSPTPTDPDATDKQTDADTDDTATEEMGGETATPPPNADQEVEVGAGGLNFAPESFEISVGDTVLWEWVGGGHNISYDDGDVPAGTAWDGDDEDIYSEGHVHFFTFETPGEYDYYCQPHQTSGMTGSFTVTE